MLAHGGRFIPEATALECVGGYCVALDLTSRTLQRQAMKTLGTIDIAKGYDTFLPLSPFISAERVLDPHDLVLELRVNGEMRQRDNTGGMHIKIPALISFLSQAFTLVPGDIILTGTPAGVGPIFKGDQLEVKCLQGDEVLVQDSFSVAS
jgi:2-keto-4-pentenoate hydratase/2-oxohepta-3-ene-1,7-dioic acid hydratase in catechol pathway